MSEDMILMSKKSLEFACKMTRTREARILELEGVLKDFAEHGCRHDLLPTVMLSKGSEQDRVVSLMDFYTSYLRSMDACIRKRAKEVLG